MDLRDYRRILTEKWPVLAAGLLVGLLVATVLALLQPQRYTSQSSIQLAAAADDLSGAYNGVRLAREKAVDYAAVAGRGRLAAEAARALVPPVDADTLAGALSVSAEPDAPVLTTTASGTTPEQAQAFARAGSDALVGLVNGLERAPGTVPESGVTARLVQPATLDSRSTSPPVTLQLLLGAATGLALGIVVVLVGHALDGSLWSRSRAEGAAGTSVLAVVERRREVTRHPLLTDPDAPDVLQDSFQHLRTALAHRPDTPLDGVLVVCSARSGEGRSTVVVNLATVLARAGRSVLVVDADLRAPHLHTLLGVDDREGLDELATDGAPGDEDHGPRPQVTKAGFDVVTAGQGIADPAALLASPTVDAFLDAIRHRYDTVLVDTPPLVAMPDAAAVTHGRHPTLLVVSCRRTTHDDVRRARAGLDAVGVAVVGAVVTFAPQEHHESPARARRRAEPPTPPEDGTGDDRPAPADTEDDHDSVGVGATGAERADEGPSRAS